MTPVSRGKRASDATDERLLAGQLYGLEKFWAFLKYSRDKPKVNGKLSDILKNYKRLEDFRVDGASFPQQFYPTKSGIIVSRHRPDWCVFRPLDTFFHLADDTSTGSDRRCCSENW